MNIVPALTGITSFLGFISIVAYFYLLVQRRRTENSVRHIVEGERIFNPDQVVAILGQFTSDENRIKALRALTQYDKAKAQAFLDKVKNNVDLDRLNRNTLSDRRRRLVIVAGFFFLLSIVGYSYTKVRNPAGPDVESKQHLNGASASQTASNGVRAADSAPASAAACEFKNISSLGWRGGNKTNFCIGRGYNGVTNFDRGGNDYDKFGGGWCWKGESDAVCHAELNSQEPCADVQPQTGRCLRLIYQ